MSDDIVKGMVAGAFGLIGTLVPLCVSWARDRDTVTQRSRQLDEATKRIQFWDQWLKLAVSVNDPELDAARERVRRELVTLCQMFSGESASIHQQNSIQESKASAFQGKLHKLSILRKALLLYRPERQLAWFPRFFFYLFIIEAISIPFMPDMAGEWASGVFGSLVLVLIFWLLSRWAERPRKTADIASAPPPIPPTA